MAFGKLVEVDCRSAPILLKTEEPGLVLMVTTVGGTRRCYSNKVAPIAAPVCELAFHFCQSPDKFVANKAHGTYKFRKKYRSAVRSLIREGLARPVAEFKKSYIVAIDSPDAVCQALKAACWSV